MRLVAGSAGGRCDFYGGTIPLKPPVLGVLSLVARWRLRLVAGSEGAGVFSKVGRPPLKPPVLGVLSLVARWRLRLWRVQRGPL